MRRMMTALVIVVSAALVAGAADDKYTSKEGKYAVQFPDGAKVKTDTKKAGALDIKVTSVENTERAYMVMYMDMPAEVKNVPAKTILDGAEKGGVTQSGGKLDSSKDFEFGKDKLPGREFVVDKDGNKVRTRIIMADTRMYVVIVGGKMDFATTKDGTKFLDSFSITK